MLFVVTTLSVILSVTLSKDTLSNDLCNWNDVAEKQKGENGAEAAQILDSSKDITDMGSILEDGKEDTQAPAFRKLLQDDDVFANCKSWKVRYRTQVEDVFMPLSTSKLYEGYAMIPVFGGGAIQADFVRPCPAAVVIHQFRCHARSVCAPVSYAARMNADPIDIESN